MALQIPNCFLLPGSLLIMPSKSSLTNTQCPCGLYLNIDFICKWTCLFVDISVVKAPTVVGSSPVWTRIAFFKNTDICCWLENLWHAKILCNLRVSKVVLCSHIATVLHVLTTGILFGSLYNLASIAGVIGTLIVARNSVSVGGISDDVDS